MARSTAALSTEVVAQVLQAAGPGGATPEMLEAKLPGVSRSTLTRRLKALEDAGAVKVQGRGRTVRYSAVAEYSIEDVRRYFERDWQTRPAASFQEQLLQPSPGLDPGMAARLVKLQGSPSAGQKISSGFPD